MMIPIQDMTWQDLMTTIDRAHAVYDRRCRRRLADIDADGGSTAHAVEAAALRRSLDMSRQYIASTADVWVLSAISDQARAWRMDRTPSTDPA